MLLNNKKNDEEIIQQHSSTIEIPLSVWQVIQDQAECIKLKDNQMDEIVVQMKNGNFYLPPTTYP